MFAGKRRRAEEIVFVLCFLFHVFHFLFLFYLYIYIYICIFCFVVFLFKKFICYVYMYIYFPFFPSFVHERLCYVISKNFLVGEIIKDGGEG